MVGGVPIAAAIFLGVLLGGGIGFVNGTVIAKWKIPPFIATLAMMTIGRGIAYVYTDGKPVRFDNDSLSWIGNGYVNAVPVPVLIMFACLFFFAFVLHKTQYGSRVYAVGGNREAARYSGIRIPAVEISVYVISGILSAVSGIILSSRMLSAQPVAGQGAELDAIAAVVLGGTSLSGGVGSLGGTMIGALFIGMMNNGLNIIQLPFYWQQIIKGIVIIMAVLVDVVKNKKLVD
jgi:ribose transport system permease protein